MRSDHLLGVINYAIEQAESSAGQVNPLAWGPNQNAIGERCDSADATDEERAADYQDLIAVLQDMKSELLQLVGSDYNHCEIFIGTKRE